MRSHQRVSLALTVSVACAASGTLAARPLASIPFRLPYNIPVVDGAIGEQPVAFIVDTGSFAELALPMDLMPQGKQPASSVPSSVANSEGMRLAPPSIEVRNVRLGDFEVGSLVAHSDVPGARVEHGALLGYGFLKRFIFVIDYPARRLVLYRQDDEHVIEEICGAPAFPINTSGELVSSRLTTPSGNLNVFWDTGWSWSTLRPSSVPGMPAAADGSLVLQGVSVGSQSLGDLSFRAREFAAPDRDGVIGADYLASHVWCVDPLRQRAAIR
jgi:hypothetical protein